MIVSLDELRLFRAQVVESVKSYQSCTLQIYFSAKDLQKQAIIEQEKLEVMFSVCIEP